MSMDQNQKCILDFYNRQVMEHPENPAMLGCDSLLSRDIRVVQENALIDRIRKEFSPGKRFRILELGCGAGRWLELFSPFSMGMVGVDFSPAAIEMARKKQIPGVAFVCSGIEEFEPNGTYDIIYFSSVLQYLSDRQVWNVLAKYREYLAENGIFIIRDTFHEHTSKFYLSAGYMTNYRSESDFFITLMVMDMQPISVFQAFYYPWVPAFVLNNQKLNRIYRDLPNREMWMARIVPLLVKSWQTLPGHRFILARRRTWR